MAGGGGVPLLRLSVGPDSVCSLATLFARLPPVLEMSSSVSVKVCVMKHSKKQLGACGDDARARGGASRLIAPLAQPDRTKVNPIRPVKPLCAVRNGICYSLCFVRLVKAMSSLQRSCSTS